MVVVVSQLVLYVNHISIKQILKSHSGPEKNHCVGHGVRIVEALGTDGMALDAALMEGGQAEAEDVCGQQG